RRTKTAPLLRRASLKTAGLRYPRAFFGIKAPPHAFLGVRITTNYVALSSKLGPHEIVMPLGGDGSARVEPHAVSSGLFGQVECRVGGIEHKFRRRVSFGLLCHASADGDGQGLAPRQIRLLSGFFLGPVGPSELKATLGYGLAQRLDKCLRLSGGTTGKNQDELFASITESLCPTWHLRHHRGHDPENLVAGLVPMSVIELLEMVHIAHGDCIVAAELLQEPVESPTGGESSQLVAVGEFVAVLKHRDHQHQGGRPRVNEKRLRLCRLVHSQEYCDQRPEHSLLNFSSPAENQHQENQRRHYKGKHFAAWKRDQSAAGFAPEEEGPQRRDFADAKPRHAENLGADESQPHDSAAGQHPALAHPLEDDKVERQEEHSRQPGDASFRWQASPGPHAKPD